MRKNMLLLSLLIVVAITVLASDYPVPTAWVNDYAGVLTNSQKQELDGLLKNFEITTTNQIFVCIMPNLPADATLEEYVNDLFAAWKPGQQGKDNGVLLAVFINDRKLRIEVGYGLEAKLTDAASKLIIANDITPSLKQGAYYQGIKNGLDKMMRTITGEYKPQPSTTRSREPPPREPRSKYIWVDVLLVLLDEIGLLTVEGVLLWGFPFTIILIAILAFIKNRDRSWSSESRSARDWSGGSDSDSSSSSSWDDDGDRDSDSSSSSSWSDDDDDDDDDDSGFSGGGGGSSGGGGASGSW